jgi:hypothetical protein
LVVCFCADAPLAQLAEQLTLNQWVPGSSPGGRTKKKTDKPLHCRGFSLSSTFSHRRPLAPKTFESAARRDF